MSFILDESYELDAWSMNQVKYKAQSVLLYQLGNQHEPNPGNQGSIKFPPFCVILTTLSAVGISDKVPVLVE